MPGVSRSGATISAGLFLGLDRELAARFGFLLAIPAVFASGLFSLPDAFHPVGEGMSASGPQLVVATVIAFVVGFAAVAWFLRFLVRHSMYWFVGYRVRARRGRADPARHRGGGRDMTVILLRHGRSTSNTAHTLAGRTEGVDLDDKGREQAAGAGRPDRRRCRSARSCARRCCAAGAPSSRWPPRSGWSRWSTSGISEVDYGEWTGRKIGDLVKEPLWAVVQQQPSAAVFPGGEGLAAGAGARGGRGPRARPPAGRAARAATCCGWPARTAT